MGMPPQSRREQMLKSRRTQLRAGAAMRRKQGWTWERIDDPPDMPDSYRGFVCAHINAFYVVQLFDVPTDIGLVQHLIVRPNVGGKNREPPWRDMQRIKRELVGPDAEAVQVYPRERDIVDSADVYHLFVLPYDHALPFGLHRECGIPRRGV